MTSRDEVQDALLDEIKKRAEGANALNLLWLAEAYAWLVNPNQGHGNTTVSGS
jgi:hypothetical protein